MSSGVVVYLSHLGNFHLLKKSLHSLRENWLSRYPYPVIVFHEGDLGPSHGDSLRAIYDHCELRKIDFSAPEPQPDWQGLERHGVGYRRMCRFFSIDLWEELSEFDFVLRLDSDSYLCSMIPGDIFEDMQRMGKKYVYRCKMRETWEPGICEIEEIVGASLPNRLVYYNNFFATDIRFWRSPSVEAVLKELDDAGGFFCYRWGDAVVHTLICRRFLNPAEIWHCQHFDYTHRNERQSWRAVGSITLPMDLLRLYPNKTFVETGTFMGGAVRAALAAGFARVVSLDIQLRRDRLQDLESNPAVELVEGDSHETFEKVMQQIDHPATIWLDAHQHGVVTSPHGDAPLLEELDVLAKHPIRSHTILIDDVRVFGESGKSDDWGQLIREQGGVELVARTLRKINPRYNIEFRDSRVFPRDILVASVDHT